MPRNSLRLRIGNYAALVKSGICALLIIFYLGPFLDLFTDLFGVLTAGWYSQEILRFGEAVFDHFYGI